MNKLYNVLISVALCFGVIAPAQAGIFSKAAKGGAIVGTVKAAKVLSNAPKLKAAKGPLIPGELNVSSYKSLVKNRVLSTNKNIDKYNAPQAHHIPSNKYMATKGISSGDAVAVEMQAARHGLTRTYKSGNKPILSAKEAPREALAKDIKDMRQVYQENNLYNANTRQSLQKVIAQNKQKFPHLYAKQTSGINK